MLKMLMKFFKRNCFHTFSLVVAKAFNFGQFGEKLAVTLWERKKNSMSRIRIIEGNIVCCVMYILIISLKVCRETKEQPNEKNDDNSKLKV